MHKTFTLLTVMAGIALTSPAFADSKEVQDDKQAIQADIGAIHKDNIALKKDRSTLSRDRAAKAQDKVNDDTAKQAADSTRIGAVQTAIAEKKAEKGADRKILEHDQSELVEDTAKPENNQ